VSQLAHGGQVTAMQGKTDRVLPSNKCILQCQECCDCCCSHAWPFQDTIALERCDDNWLAQPCCHHSPQNYGVLKGKVAHANLASINAVKLPLRGFNLCWM